jgi:hypothetical protein
METRSQTKQHEMEEKLSKLLAIMTSVQEQQAKQEELAKGHQADLEKVAGTQQEQAERQEDLARRQEAKWQQFMETQETSSISSQKLKQPCKLFKMMSRQ